MVKSNFTFKVNDQIKLAQSYEFILMNHLNMYYKGIENISCQSDLMRYVGKLDAIDQSVVNNSSICFVVSYNGKNCLFLGDCVTDSDLMEQIESKFGFEFHFEAIKLPHHGSRYNITNEFIKRYTADEYYVSTNSKIFDHPDIECLASIICLNEKYKEIIFNYPISIAEILDNQEWKKKYKYDLVVGDGKKVVERSY